MAGTFPQGGSEYGGVPGLIQPLPHDIEDSAYEQASLAVRTETWPPGDPLTTVEGVRDAEEQEAEKRR